jgi:hypothetical protein
MVPYIDGTIAHSRYLVDMIYYSVFYRQGLVTDWLVNKIG